MTDQLNIEEREDTRMTVGRVPIRLAAGGRAHYYILTCAHGETELHDINDVNPSVVKANLIEAHHATTGCSCQPE